MAEAVALGPKGPQALAGNDMSWLPGEFYGCGESAVPQSPADKRLCLTRHFTCWNGPQAQAEGPADPRSNSPSGLIWKALLKEPSPSPSPS